MIHLEFRDATLVATLERNEQNTIDEHLADALDHALEQAEQRGIAVLHLRSATPHFCGGADPARVRRWLDPDGAAGLGTDGGRWARLFERIENSPVVAFAEMRGNALGAGLGLALACDLRIAAASARIGVPEVRVGLLPAGMTVQRLTELGGIVTAQRLLLGGDIIDGAEAHRLGLVHWIAADDALESNAAVTVQRVAKQSSAALREAKRVLASARSGGRDQTAAIEKTAFERLIADEEPRRRIESLLGRLDARS